MSPKQPQTRVFDSSLSIAHQQSPGGPRVFFHSSYILVRPSDSADKAQLVLVQTRQVGETGFCRKSCRMDLVSRTAAERNGLHEITWSYCAKTALNCMSWGIQAVSSKQDFHCATHVQHSYHPNDALKISSCSQKKDVEQQQVLLWTQNAT